MILVGLAIILILMIPLVQAQNTTFSTNASDVKIIKNYTDRTLTLLNTTTNETISITSIPQEDENMTTNQTTQSNTENLTSNETLTHKKTTNETLTTNTPNTSNINLTDKFNTLQGK